GRRHEHGGVLAGTAAAVRADGGTRPPVAGVLAQRRTTLALARTAADRRHGGAGLMRAPRSPVARLLLALCLLLLAPAVLAGVDAKYPQLQQVFPQATRFGDIEGTPPAAAVYQGDKTIGYVFETVMVAPVPAYSGAPINMLVSIGTDGS